MNWSDEILAKLNPQQREAVVDETDALLIMAGAGSGKTRVLTNKIGYILSQNKVPPWRILAFTFTNKAAKEMKERLNTMLGSSVGDSLWVSTFHSTCVRILRRYSEEAGLGNNFTIYDTDDAGRLLRDIVKDFGIDVKIRPVKSFANKISDLKNELINGRDYAEFAAQSGDVMEEMNAKVYTEYQTRLAKLNAVDFDDLIFKTVLLLKNNEQVQSFYNNKFAHIFVDEYQDTNHAQYILLRLLSGYDTNFDSVKNLLRPKIAVVGDSDQSIYAFRGATIRNITEFEDDFPNSKVITLEQNYRSTNTILGAANAVIAKNQRKHKKELWSENGEGVKIEKYNAPTGYDEARWVAEKIQNLTEKEGVNFRDIAIIYRQNALSRLFEEKLTNLGFAKNYEVIGGFRFYERAEIKDILAYLHVIVNRDDDVHLRRIINQPRRGIGSTSEEKVAKFAISHGFSFWETLDMLEEVEGVTGATAQKFFGFIELIEKFASFAKGMIGESGEKIEVDEDGIKIGEIVKYVIEETGYLNMLLASDDIQDRVRAENVEELVSAADSFVPLPLIDDETGQVIKESKEARGIDGLREFIEQVSLSADSDKFADQEFDEFGEIAQVDDRGKITMMTLHTAKGLEFEHIFLVGFEDGTLPHVNSMGSEDDIGEERRLAYVGITRAKKHLYLSWSAQRQMFGKETSYAPSRFLRDIPTQLIQEANSTDGLYQRGLNNMPNFMRSKSTKQTPNSWWNEEKSKIKVEKNEPEVIEPLYEKSPKLKTADGKWEVGNQINHNAFGKGQIISIDGSDGKEVADINFEDEGMKQILLKFAKIEKIN